MKFADVAVNVPLRAGDRVFTFSVPDALEPRIAPGVPVRIRFGPRATSGYIVRLLDQVDREVRPLTGVDDRLPVLPADLLALAKEAVEETLKVGPAYAKANFWNVMNSRTFRRFESWKLDGERIYEMNAGISRRFQSNPCLHSF